MYFGEKPRKGLSKFVAVLTALAIASASLLAVPAYAAEGGSEGQNPVVEFFGNLADGAAQLFGLGDDGVETYAVGDVVENSPVADRDSTNDWNTVLTEDGQVSTQNIGRIWTDKSVFTDKYDFQGGLTGTSISKAEGSDFLVGLSALSSTSNLKTVTTSTTPLDIVLVVDVSSSMDERDMGYEYTPAYNPNRYTTYYIQLENGNWQQLRSDTDRGERYWYYNTGEWWDSTEVRVTPKTSAEDTNPDHVQFYTRGAWEQTRMEALQNAANSFVKEVAVLNDGIADQSQQHRISLVKFSGNQRDQEGDDTYNDRGHTVNYSQVVKGLDAYDSSNCSTLEEAINDLSGNGPTQANNGLLQAQSVLNGANRDSKKVVIFFTDGNPTSWDEWDNSVAGGAIDCAYDMKQDGTQVYCIGVFEDANPSDTSNRFNRYMNAVSSNYEEAQCVNRWGQQTGNYSNLQLGGRNGADLPADERPQYYYAAEDAASLKQAFEGITTSITEDNASGSPIEDVTVEGETNPGNLAFHDELGAYMEVAGDTMQIVYADQPITSSRRTSQNIEGGVVYTYPFSGTVHANEAYGDKEANLSGLQIRVTHYNDPAKGDLVEAVIPADLIPMRNYDVDTENGTMTVSSTYPVRLFYSVQVKTEAAQQLADPSSAIYTSNYVANNTNEDGTGVEFYSNLYTNSNGDGFVGDTTATFKPSNGNRFYYFTANTPLYTSNDGSDTQADRSFINGDNTVYYKDTYWVQTGGTVEDPETGEQIPAAEEKTEYVALSTSDIRSSVLYQNQYGSGAYLPAQTHNEGKIAGLYAAKGDSGNPTETAGDTLNPAWAGENISARMGNNGRLALELPGTLAVSKNVAFGDNYGNTGFDETVYTEDTDYAINITLTGEDNQPVSGTFKAQVKNAQGAVVSNPTDGYFDITFTNGKATHSIKHGETLYIYGLDAGATYEVTETAPGDGFTTTYDDNAKGTIAVSQTSSTTVTNTYTLESTELTGSTDLKVSKTLNNRDWREGDSFTFQIAAGQSTPNAPMPEKTTVTIDSTNKDAGASFGNISYSTPGQYVYIISEVVPTEDALTGVTYSRARYRVVVNVEDNRNGTMTATSIMTQIMDDAGNNVENGAAIDTHTAAFTNTYRTSDQGGTANIGGTKRFTDKTGATTLADWTFDFTLTAVGGYPSDKNPGEPGAEGTVYDIDAADVPMPADAQGTSKTVTLSGGAQVFNFGEMTYDGNDVGNTYVYAITEVTGDNDKMTYDRDTEYVTVTVTEVQDGKVAVINAVADRNAADVVFDNSYAPESAKLTGNTALGGTKTITGRDMLEGESYNFTLEYVGGADGTTPAEEGWIELPDEADMKAIVSGAKKDVDTPFTFGDITFNHVGKYTFTISENVPTDEDALGGMTYDNHKCTVTVDVAYDKDNNKLVASTDYGTFDNRASNEFVNEYESSFNYGTTTAGGLNVSKTLTGRDMLDGEFRFTITAANVEGNPALTDNKLAEADENFSNGGANDGVANVMSKLRGITFDQDDAGKTFIYTVAETKGDLANVDYDANVYTVEIKVVDDNDGTMHTETTVRNADGEQVGEVATWDDQATEGSTVATVAFKNTYTPDEAELTEGTDTGLKVTKKVTGAPTDADFNFTLVLTGQPEGSKVGGVTEDGEGNMIATTKVDHNFTADEVAAGTAAEGLFNTLTFDKAGTYTFDVIENEAQGDGAEDNWPAGWKYDTSTRHYTVVVTDENPAHAEDESQPLYDGKLYIQSVSPYNQTFTNSYNAEPVVVGPEGDQAISISKKVEGTAFDGSFGFTLAHVNPDDEKWSNVEFAEGATEATVSDFNRDETKTTTFGNITFKAEGDYEFTVSETKVNDAALPEQDGNGWTYDRDADTVTIHVSKVNPDTNEYDGVLHATIEGTASFTNSYAATGELIGQDNLKVTKTFTGRANDAWLESDEFQFNIAPADDDKVSEGVTTADAVTAGDVVMPENTQITITDEDATTFTKAFDNITFKEAGTYTFKVNEDLPAEATADNNWTVDGITYDHNVKTVVVNVADNHDGTLTASVDTAKSDTLEFKNTYDTTEITVQSLDLGLEGNKVLTGREWETGDTFTFTITKGECTYPNSATKLPDDVVNATLPQTTSVTIAPATDGSDTSSNGTTSAHFAFGDDQTVDVSRFTFTEPGTYRYLIEETNPNVTAAGSGIIGVTYDETTYRLTVVVTDKGDGTMSQTHAIAKQPAGSDEWVDLAEGEDISFTNAFSVDSVAPSFNVYKQFSGSDQAMTDNKFSFVIAPAGWANNADTTDQVDTGLTFDGDNSEHPMPMVDGKVSDTVGSIIRGDVVFGDTTFTHDNVGKTYRYVVSEKQPTDDGTIDGNGLDGATFDDASGKWTYKGVTYDNATHYLYAKVVSQQVEQPEGSGTYVEAVRVYTAGEAEWNADQQAVVGDAVFNNTYAATGTLEGESQLKVTKKVVGAEFDENMSFDFTMKLQKAVATDSQTDISDGVQVEQGGQMVVMPADGIEATITGGEGVTDGQKTVGFGKMTFTKAGTYTFVVSENAPDPAEDHWTYDSSEKTITVTVVDNNDGTMTVKPQENYDTTFINIYYNPEEAKSGSVTNPNGSSSDNASAATVGSVIEYKVNWVNTAQDENGKPTVATVVVTDKLPEHTSLVEDSISEGGSYDADTKTITWTFESQPAGAMGTVSFKVTVDESALEGGSVSNKATIGENDTVVETNTVTTTIESGNLEISKTVEVNADQGTTVDTNKLFEFTVEFKTAGDNGVELTGSYGIQGAFSAEGEAITTVKSGDKIYLHHGNTATVAGLPEGAVYTVTETEVADDGYTQTAPADDDGKAIAATGTIVKGDTPAKAAFTNAYDAASAEGVPAGFTFKKVFEGREWTDAYSFQFKLTPDGDAPMPVANEANGTVVADDNVSLIRTVTGPQDSGEATFDFGSITYNKVGAYKYTVSEVKGDNAGITYSKNVAEVKVDVEDHGEGDLVATATISNNTFTNTYKTGEVVYDTAAGLEIVKNMTGHAIGAGDFTFTMTGKDQASIDRLNGGQPLEFSTKGAELGEGEASNTATETIKALTGLTFTQQDAGKTYTYTVAEENGGKAGVTYDNSKYEVKFVVTENGEGTLNVETFVDGAPQGVVSGAIATNALPAQLVFNNSYEAGTVVVGGDTGVSFTGGKQLANRPLENGEFTFNVYDAKDVLVTSGTNDADGTITFNGITYDMAKLNADKASGAAMETAGEDGSTVYRYIYTITEDQTDFKQDGITAIVSSIDVTVEVTDDNQGHLTAKVVTPAKDIQFKNIYGNGEDGTFTSNLKGNKVVAVDSGDNAPGRDGFQFEVTVPEGAPEPECTTATSDESGNVDFGEIVFTMENVFGDTGDKVEAEAAAAEGEDAAIETMSAQRDKTFEYVVSEVNDGKPGVTYDTNSYTVTYTVIDLGNGTLDVQKTVAMGAQQGNDFTFTNRYSVTPGDSSLTGNGGFVINKTLTSNTGRTLVDGEFGFALTDVATGEVVKTAANAADGTVSFPAVTFTEPGTYNYTLSEVEGDAANVTYDTDQYNVTAKVTDMGDGTLKVEWTVEGVDPSEAIVFENAYEADPTSIAFKAAKVLDGRELTDGEFTFELRENGKVIDTATNDADGTVAFEKVEYTEPGAHDYEIAEVKGDDSTITYDDTVFTVHVSVVDNTQTGSLDASDWSYGENGAPVFHNTYTKPAEPPAPKPEEPKPEVIPATGDAAAAAVMATAGIGAALAAAGYVTSKRRGE